MKIKYMLHPKVDPEVLLGQGTYQAGSGGIEYLPEKRCVLKFCFCEIQGLRGGNWSQCPLTGSALGYIMKNPYPYCFPSVVKFCAVSAAITYVSLYIKPYLHYKKMLVESITERKYLLCCIRIYNLVIFDCGML